MRRRRRPIEADRGDRLRSRLQRSHVDPPRLRVRLPHVELAEDLGAERRALETLASSVAPEGAVRFEGWRAPEEMPTWIAGAAVCINPLRRTRQTEVALSHKLFQYMLGARPVVVTDCAAMRRVVEDAGAGIVVPDRQVDAYARAIVELLSDSDRSQALGAAGREAVLDRYHWDEAVRPLLAAYREVAA